MLKKHVVWRKKTNGLDNAEPTEDSSDYHVTTSQHARQAEDESDHEVEGGRGRGRNAKAARPKKATNTLNQKLIVEEARAAVRGGKGGKRKVLRCSKASRSQLRPLTVTL